MWHLLGGHDGNEYYGFAVVVSFVGLQHSQVEVDHRLAKSLNQIGEVSAGGVSRVLGLTSL
jgi:hypothetical protein